MWFLQFSLQWRHISSANREPLSVFEELPVPIEEQGMSCNERERETQVYCRSLQKKRKTLLSTRNHARNSCVCHRSLPQPSSVRVFGCQNRNFVQHCLSNTWLSLFVVRKKNYHVDNCTSVINTSELTARLNYESSGQSCAQCDAKLLQRHTLASVSTRIIFNSYLFFFKLYVT